MTVQLGLFHSPMDIRLVVKKVVWVILRELIMCIIDIIATLINLMLSALCDPVEKLISNRVIIHCRFTEAAGHNLHQMPTWRLALQRVPLHLVTE